MIKFLIGGSPCTHWSIAQSKNRETQAEGEGWELFRNYLMARDRFAPEFFLYENNKSAAQAIKDQISAELGAPLQYINSALVSAQNRQRFYVHNFGNVPQPTDRGILLQDVLEQGASIREKAYTLTAAAHSATPEDALKRHARNVVAEAVDYAPHKNSDIVVTDNNIRCQRRDKKHSTIQGTHVTFGDSKTQTLGTSHIPMTLEQMTLESFAGREKAECLRATYDKCGRRNFEENTIRTKGYQGVPVRIGEIEAQELDTEYFKGAFEGNLIGQIVNKGTYKNGKQPSQQYRVYAADGKSICVDRDSRKYYACPTDPGAPARPVYRVLDGKIEIKGQLYPIKLPDGYYIIRKLTVTECCRLQTMPDDYCRAVSASQAYRGLGNGWTAEVIIHLLAHALRGVPQNEEIMVLSMYDGIGTGRYCFDKLGYHNITYYAYEIDKHAIQIAKSNYPDIIQCGDAFEVRADNWAFAVPKAVAL